MTIYELRCEKTGLRGFRPGPTQTGLCSYRRWLEAWNFRFRKKGDCSIRVAKTKGLISLAVTAKLICVFVLHMQKAGFLITRLIYVMTIKSNNQVLIQSDTNLLPNQNYMYT